MKEEFQEKVLLALLKCELPYNDAIAAILEKAMKKTVSRNAVATTLVRLEAKGMVRSEMRKFPGQGYRKRIYTITPSGMDMVESNEQIRMRLRSLPQLSPHPSQLGDQCDVLEELGIQFTCCNSCHEDWDKFGIEMCHTTLKTGQYLHVCCEAARVYREMTYVEEKHEVAVS